MSVLSLDDAKDWLKITTAENDFKLQSVIDGAEAALGEACGPLAVQTETVRLDGGVGVLWLPVSPVSSLTSVTPADSVALSLADLYLDKRKGTVEQNSGSGFYARYYTVVYEAGRDSCPEDLLTAVKELVRSNWSASQRGSARQATQQSTETANTVPGGYREFPWEVERRIARHRIVIA